MSKQALSVFSPSVRASGAVVAYRCVGFDGAQISTAGAKVMGVAEYGADDGQLVPVVVVGTATVETGAAVDVGDSLIVDAEGRAIPTTGALAVKAGATAVLSTAASGVILAGAELPEFVFADALEAAAGAGAFIEVLLRR